MKSLNTGRRSRRSLRRIVAGGAVLALVGTLSGALFNSASATHPTVSGKVDCVNGAWVVKWTVGGDTAYPNATATIKSQSLATDPTLVGKAVKNTQTVNGTQTGAVAASTTYTQTVKVQFDTHSPGSLVTKSGSVTTGKDCAEEEKVTICHRTASYSNPYVKITVARSAVDGIAGNSGNQPDHYGEHRGPIFYPTIPQHTEWGDIIPPVSGAHSGYNWTAEGQAVYNNGCVLPVKKVTIPVMPEKEDLCNPQGVTSNIRWTSVPPSTPDYTVTGTSTSDLNIALNDSKAEWSDGTTAPKVFVLGKDSGEMCPPPVTPPVVTPPVVVPPVVTPPVVTPPVVTPPVVIPPVVTPPATKNKGSVYGSCVTPTRGEGVAKGRVTNAHSTRVTVKQNGKVVKTRVVAPGARFRMEMNKLRVGSAITLIMGGKKVDRDFVENDCKDKLTHVGLPRIASAQSKG